MLKYLVILLDDNSVSFCHYSNRKEHRLIPYDVLRETLNFALKENLSIQVVWPDYELPESFKDIINSVEHIDIKSLTSAKATYDADIIVLDKNFHEGCPEGATAVVRMSIFDLISNPAIANSLISKASRVNFVFTDVEKFEDSLAKTYEEALTFLSEFVLNEYKRGHTVEVNLITDRIMLDKMNNCNAGHESLCIAPDGKFYICPAFYYSNENSEGSSSSGPCVKNESLYHLDHAPICKQCDAYNCRRCVWHNKAFTHEVNTPSHEQCVMAHIEREVSRRLLESFREYGIFMPETKIEKLEYNDPLIKVIKQTRL